MKELIRNIAIGWLVAITMISIVALLLVFGFETVASAMMLCMLILPLILITGLAIAVLIMPDFPS